MLEITKCSLIGDFLKPCKSLDSKLNDPGTRQKGIRFLEFMNLDTFTRSRDLVSYHLNSKDKGVILNYCPWCGEKLHNEFEENK